MKVYFISGLAADSRVFKHIQLPSGYQAHYLDWITPLPNESLKGYALRLSEAIDLKEPFVIAGLSMGGMIATEIANIYQPAACILFCSVIALAVCLHCAHRLAVRITVLSIDKHTEQTDSTMMCVQCFGMRVECQTHGSPGKLYSDVVTTTHNADALTQSLPNHIKCTGVVAFSTHTNVVTGR